MIALINDFHDTEARVRPGPVDDPLYPDVIGTLTHRQVLGARRKLCGMSGCKCSDWTGVRGGRYWIEGEPGEPRYRVDADGFYRRLPDYEIIDAWGDDDA